MNPDEIAGLVDIKNASREGSVGLLIGGPVSVGGEGGRV